MNLPLWSLGDWFPKPGINITEISWGWNCIWIAQWKYTNSAYWQSLLLHAQVMYWSYTHPYKPFVYWHGPFRADVSSWKRSPAWLPPASSWVHTKQLYGITYVSDFFAKTSFWPLSIPSQLAVDCSLAEGLPSDYSSKDLTRAPSQRGLTLKWINVLSC